MNEIACYSSGDNDFFGPLCVVACYLNDDDYLFVKSLDLKDDYDDDKIMELGKLLKERLTYSLLLLDNSHYNDMNKKLTTIKSILYNQAIINIMQRIKADSYNIYCDDFLSSKKYYKNLKYKTIVVHNIEFTSKDTLGMLCAKILSQYAYLQYFRNMNNSLKITLPRGNNIIANEIGYKLVNEYDLSILNKIAKINMPNYKQIIEKMD